MLEVKQLFKKLLQVGPGFQKTGREGEGEGWGRENKGGRRGKRGRKGKAEEGKSTSRKARSKEDTRRQV